ncbi:MAG TPA: folylpolyglutamate synthase/dihydrofolate synthase family protein [Anaeromyxobacteraceae bacterium]|nr:folylpolyglutamate synthase/dihydrofolate synthase family protein [Anaeromyxobacteraceae bacterium]
MDPHAYLASLQPHSIRLGLERMQRALDSLGHPERGLRVLHVAGTNGKGSTCAMAATALASAGHAVGLYTSPHLVRFNERIVARGAEISDEELARLIGDIRRACPWHEVAGPERLTYFEFATLLALLRFAEARVDAAVLEVGLGGRWDATNVITPLACAVSRIGLDHVETLGPTLDAIAREKAGIFKQGVPAVTLASQPPEALAALREEASARGAPLEAVAAVYDGPIALRGPHQRENAALAAAALALLDRAGLAVPPEAARRGIATASWPGRMEEIAGVFLDGAHNPDGARALAAALQELPGGSASEIVLGVLGDKDVAGILDALAPVARSLHVVTPPSPRARPAADTAAIAVARGLNAHAHASLEEAVDCARRAGAARSAPVCIAGSLYLVGAARAALDA